MNQELELTLARFIKEFNISISPIEVNYFLKNEIYSRSLSRLNDDILIMIQEFLPFSSQLSLARTCKEYYSNQMDGLHEKTVDRIYPNNTISNSKEKWKNHCINWLINILNDDSEIADIFNTIKENEKSILKHKEKVIEYKIYYSLAKSLNNNIGYESNFNLIHNSFLKWAIYFHSRNLDSAKNKLKTTFDNLSEYGHELINLIIWTSSSDRLSDIPAVDFKLYGPGF